MPAIAGTVCKLLVDGAQTGFTANIYNQDETALNLDVPLYSAGNNTATLQQGFPVAGSYRIVVYTAEGVYHASTILQVFSQTEGVSADEIFTDPRWELMMSRLNSARVTVKLESSRISINGLEEQTITIIQGVDWTLEAEILIEIPTDAVLEFLVQDSDKFSTVVVGSTSLVDNCIFLTLDSEQTKLLTHHEYRYNLTYELGEDKMPIMMGRAVIQKSVML